MMMLALVWDEEKMYRVLGEDDKNGGEMDCYNGCTRGLGMSKRLSGLRS